MIDLEQHARRSALEGAVVQALAVPARIAAGLAEALAERRDAVCAVPPPCWNPKPAGQCALALAPGSTAAIRVHVLNCGWTPRIVRITAPGRLAAWLDFEPSALVVDPQERRTFRVTARMPIGEKPNGPMSGVVLVRGCIDHYIRVDIAVGKTECRPGCDIVINDCVDQVHHWYEHFYCPRPCPNPNRPATKDG